MKKQGIKFKMGSKVTGADVVDGAVTTPFAQFTCACLRSVPLEK